MAIPDKDYFDKKFSGIDKKFEEQKEYIDKKFDDLNERTARGMKDLQERLDVKQRVEKLERNYEKIKAALNL